MGVMRKDKEITNVGEMKKILTTAKFVTFAMCLNNKPYPVSLSQGYDEEKTAYIFTVQETARSLRQSGANNLVWGQALVDGIYVQGAC